MRTRDIAVALATLTVAVLAPPAWGEDSARKACFPDAKRLCLKEVVTLNRHGAELCLNRRIDETSPACHAMILKVRAERQASHKPE